MREATGGTVPSLVVFAVTKAIALHGAIAPHIGVTTRVPMGFRAIHDRRADERPLSCLP